TFEHARRWADLGHDVTVITGFPNHPTGVIHPDYRGYFVKRERVEGIDLLRAWVYVAANKGFTKRVLNFLSFFFSSLALGSLLTQASAPCCRAFAAIFLRGGGLLFEPNQARAFRIRSARPLAAIGRRAGGVEEPSADPFARSDRVPSLPPGRADRSCRRIDQDIPDRRRDSRRKDQRSAERRRREVSGLRANRARRIAQGAGTGRQVHHLVHRHARNVACPRGCAAGGERAGSRSDDPFPFRRRRR